LTRWCVRNAVKLQEVQELLKQAFVESAIDELEEGGESPNVTRVALMSGVHRRDVTRLLENEPALPSDDSLLTRVLGQWRLDERFCTKQNKPRRLSIGGKTSEFGELVSSVSRELNASVILAELVRIGAVSVADGMANLEKPIYSP